MYRYWLQGAAIVDKGVGSSFGIGCQIIAYPPVLLGVVGAVVCLQAVVHRERLLLYAAGAYLFGVLLTVGYDAGRPYVLNWPLFCGGVIAVLAIIGIVKRHPVVCVAAVSVLALALAGTESFFEFAGRLGFSELGAVAAVIGTGFVLICLAFGSRVDRTIVLFGSAIFAAGMFDYLGGGGVLRYSVCVLMTVGVGAGLWVRNRDAVGVCILGLPFVPKLIMLPVRMSSWAFVLLSFVLLFVGIAISSFCKRDVADKQKTD